MNIKNICILTDGKAGDIVQCRAIAENLGYDFQEKIIGSGHIKKFKKFFVALGNFFQGKGYFYQDKDIIKEILPDMVIASGRRTLPYLKRFKQKGGDKIITVFLKKPASCSKYIDLIWVPKHDKFRGNNVITTLTSPNLITNHKLNEARENVITEISRISSKKIGVILGDPTIRVSKIGKKRKKTVIIKDFITILQNIEKQGYNFLFTVSRRTPTMLLNEIKRNFNAQKHFIWEGKGVNPYIQILANSDYLIVTGDSHNMLSEAVVTAKPVFVYKPPYLKRKLMNFLKILENEKIIFNLEERIYDYSYEPINSTIYISNKIKTFLEQKK